MKSYKSSSTVDVLDGLPLKKTEYEHNKHKQDVQTPVKTDNFMTKTVSYKGLPWV